MKKILIICLLIQITCLINMPTNANSNNHYIEKEEFLLYEATQIDKMIDENAYQKGDMFYFYDAKYNGELIKYYKDNDIYLILYKANQKSYLQKLDQDLNSQIILELDIDASDMELDNQFIYIVGNINYNAAIIKYSKELEIISINQYGGDAFETFRNIAIINQKIYLFGLKDGISHNSCFQNNGNEDEKKSFIVTLNNEYKIENSFYINKNEKLEEIYNIIVNNNQIYFLLKVKNNYYQYVLSLQLEIIESFKLNNYIDFEDIYLIQTPKMDDELIYVYTSHQIMYLGSFTNQLVNEHKLTEDLKILYTNNNQGILEIYYQQNQDVYLMEVIEYHLLFKKPKIVSYKDKTYLDTNHFKIESYLTNLEFSYDNNKNNHINLNVSGEYDAYYKAKIGKKDVWFITEYNVLPYLNVVKDGIYNKDYILTFTDNLYINDSIAYLGQTLEEGKYHIKHVTKEKTNEFDIYVIDNFYKDFYINCQDANYEVNPGSVYQYQINLQNYQLVKEVYVNKQPYAFKQDNKKITLEFYCNDSNNIKEYNIDYIVFNDGSIYEINEYFKIKTLKELPLIDIYYVDNFFNYNINDSDKSINDIIIRFYKNNELIKEEKTFLDDYKIKTQNNTKIQIILQYENGTEQFNEIVLFEMMVLETLNDEDIISIDMNFNDESLSNIKLQVTDSLKLKVSSTKVQDLSLNSYMNKDDSLSIIKISLIISGSLLLITVGIIIFKKIKHKI